MASVPLWSHLWRQPVFVPEGMVQHTLDDAVAERAAAAAALARQRTRYGSDRRTPTQEAAG
jgi:hypothetical protein